tara:strand:- start:109 stop:609 length:501 start_codon:yes stop_codon:yes gene_type:complete
MEIKDNFLPKDIFKKLQTIMYSDDMEWHYRDAQVKPTDEEYFVHCFFNNSLPLSRHFYLMDDIVTSLNAAALIQIRANLTLKKPKQLESGWHTDYTNENYCKTAILYMNNNNGYTKLKHNNKIKKISCKENRILIFDGNIEHCAGLTTDTKTRMVININYYGADKN